MTETITLDETMQEILVEAQEKFPGITVQEIVRAALQSWWGDHMLEGVNPDALLLLLDEAAADTSPALSPDEVFARLEQEIRATEHENADAA